MGQSIQGLLCCHFLVECLLGVLYAAAAAQTPAVDFKKGFPTLSEHPMSRAVAQLLVAVPYNL
eukprot:320493-Pelagomonas_calceolata.AAC.5